MIFWVVSGIMYMVQERNLVHNKSYFLWHIFNFSFWVAFAIVANERMKSRC